MKRLFIRIFPVPLITRGAEHTPAPFAAHLAPAGAHLGSEGKEHVAPTAR
jgi:hypothetical protein